MLVQRTTEPVEVVCRPDPECHTNRNADRWSVSVRVLEPERPWFLWQFPIGDQSCSQLEYGAIFNSLHIQHFVPVVGMLHTLTRVCW